MTLVLCDGEAASLKALELAAVPGLLLRKHDNRRLVAVCAWKDSRGSTAVTSPEDAPTQAQIQFVQTQLAPVTNALTTISTSRYMQNTLNYAIETHRIVVAPKKAEVEIRQNPKPPAPGSSSKQPTPPPVVGNPNDVEPTVPTLSIGGDASGTDSFGQSVVDHVLRRAKHHSARTIVFGVGNSTNDKKQIVIGAVGKALVRSVVFDPAEGGADCLPPRYSSVMKSYRDVDSNGEGLTGSLMADVRDNFYIGGASLFAVKVSGAAIRPTTGSRILVLMFVDFFGSKHQAQRAKAGAQHPASNQALLAALALARPGQDKVGILVVGSNLPDGTNEDDATAATAAASAMVDESLDAIMAAQVAGASEDAEGDANENSPSGDEAGRPPTAEDPASPSGGAASNQNANAQMLAAFPLVSYLSLEPTREFPKNPTLEQVPQQLVRQLNAIKADVLVIPPPSMLAPAGSDNSLIPQSVLEVLLGMPKPHVLVSGVQ